MPFPLFRRTVIGAAIGSALPFLLSNPVLAAEEPTLPTINVTADAGNGDVAPLAPSLAAERARLARIPGGASVIDTQAAARLLTLGDALAYQPGLVVQEFFGGTDQPRLNIRGSGIQSNPVNRGVLLLQDGLPLNEADGSFILSLLEPRNAALISVRRGANAIAPSATTLGGELDFQSLTGGSGPGTVRIEGGSFGRRNLQGAAGARSGALDGHISVSHDEGDGFRHHAESVRSSLHANAGIALGNGVENRSYLAYTDVDFKIPSVLTKERALAEPDSTMGDRPGAQDTLLNSYKRDPRREVKQLRLANRTRWGQDALRQEAGLYAQQTDDLFVDPAGQTDTRSDTYGAQWQLRSVGTRIDYRLGASWARSDMDRQLFANNGQTGKKLQRYGDYDLQAENLDLAGGIDWRLAPLWSVVADVKLSQASRDARNRASGAVLDQRWHYATPKIGVNWQRTPDQRWFANLSRSNEAPSYWEIVTGSVNPAAPAAASATLTRLGLQKALTAEFGGEGSFAVAGKPGNWSLSLYHSEVDDELISTTDASGLRVGTYNYAGGSRHQGVEAGLNGALPFFGGAALDYRLAWTYSDFHFRGGAFAGKQIAGVPRQSISAEALWHDGAWSVGPTLRWLPQSTPTDHANTLYQDQYALFGWKIDYRAGPWRAYLQLDNLADKHYVSSYAIRNRSAASDSVFLPGNGRSLLAGLAYQF